MKKENFGIEKITKIHIPEDDVKNWITTLHEGGLTDEEISAFVMSNLEKFKEESEKLRELCIMIANRKKFITEEQKKLEGLEPAGKKYEEKEKTIKLFEQENERHKEERDKILFKFRKYIDSI